MENLNDELDNYEKVAEYDELKDENKRLHKCIQELEEKINHLSQENQTLTDKLNNIEKSFAALLNTARAEIERKTEMIQTLNIEKDQLIFRQIGNRNNPPDRTRPESEDTEEHEYRGAKRKRDSPNIIENKIPRIGSPVGNRNFNLDLNEQENYKKRSDVTSGEKKKTIRTESPAFSADEETLYSRQSDTHSKYKMHPELLNKKENSHFQNEKESCKQPFDKYKRDEEKVTRRYSKSSFEKDHFRIYKEDSSWHQKSSDRYDEQYRKRERSLESDDNSKETLRSSRSRSGRFSTRFREKSRPRFSRSKVRSEFRYFDGNPRSPSPDRHIINSHSSRSRNRNDTSRMSYRNSSNGRWKRSPSKEQHSPSLSNKNAKSNSKMKNCINGKDKDFQVNNAKSHHKDNREDLSNYLEEMEEEYKMHPGNIEENQLDEETKDHYHDVNLVKLRDMKYESISNEITDIQATKMNNTINHFAQFQSPDYPDVGCSSVPMHCVNILDNGPLTPMDDPRLYNKKYFDEENIELNKQSRTINKYVLCETITLNLKSREYDMDFDLPPFERNHSKSVNDLDDEEIKNLYMNIEVDPCNISLESGELDESLNEETVLRKIDTKKVENLTVNEILRKTPVLANASKEFNENTIELQNKKENDDIPEKNCISRKESISINVHKLEKKINTEMKKLRNNPTENGKVATKISQEIDDNTRLCQNKKEIDNMIKQKKISKKESISKNVHKSESKINKETKKIRKKPTDDKIVSNTTNNANKISQETNDNSIPCQNKKENDNMQEQQGISRKESVLENVHKLEKKINKEIIKVRDQPIENEIVSNMANIARRVSQEVNDNTTLCQNQNNNILEQQYIPRKESIPEHLNKLEKTNNKEIAIENETVSNSANIANRISQDIDKNTTLCQNKKENDNMLEQDYKSRKKSISENLPKSEKKINKETKKNRKKPTQNEIVNNIGNEISQETENNLLPQNKKENCNMVAQKCVSTEGSILENVHKKETGSKNDNLFQAVNSTEKINDTFYETKNKSRKQSISENVHKSEIEIKNENVMEAVNSAEKIDHSFSERKNNSRKESISKNVHKSETASNKVNVSEAEYSSEITDKMVIIMPRGKNKISTDLITVQELMEKDSQLKHKMESLPFDKEIKNTTAIDDKNHSNFNVSEASTVLEQSKPCLINDSLKNSGPRVIIARKRRVIVSSE